MKNKVSLKVKSIPIIYQAFHNHSGCCNWFLSSVFLLSLPSSLSTPHSSVWSCSLRILPAVSASGYAVPHTYKKVSSPSHLRAVIFFSFPFISFIHLVSFLFLPCPPSCNFLPNSQSFL